MSGTEVGYQASSATDNLVAKPSKRTAEFRIVLPDQSVYWFELQRNCTGQDLVDQMCDILGIVEKDYFSLQYVERSTGCNVWLNKRLKVKEQYKGAGPPYNLKFAVRYYTDAELLLQPTTIDAFYKDLKYQIRRGEIQVPDGKKCGIGALLAQAEFGDIEKTESSPMFVYPPYFPEQQWNDGISYQIAKEHKKLKGISKKDAQLLFIRGMYETELHGVTQVPAILADGQNVVLAVGARCIRIYNSRGTIIKKIPYHVLCQIAFALRFFTLTYQTRDEDNQLIEKRMKCILPCRTVAKSIFRTIAEEQVFFYQETVTEKIRNHADNSFRRWKKFYHKMFKKQFKPKYYYDIERTKIEAYRHCWQLLHQVSGAVNARSETEVPIPHPNSLNYIINMNLSNDSDEEDDGRNSRTKSQVCWGLSKSSCNLAKELLSAPQLSLTESEENLLVFTKVESKRSSSSQEYEEEGEKTADESDSLDKAEPLSGAQGKKLCRLLLKIQDERLCTVCMDELISSVFCPCGHYVACNKCSKRLDRCPVCRQAVGYVQHVYTRF